MKFRFIFNIFLLILLSFLFFATKDIEVNNQIWLKNDDLIQIEEDFKDKVFLDKNENFLIKIALKDEFFQEDNIENLNSLVSKIKQIEGVKRLSSPLHSSYIISKDDILNIKPFNRLLEDKIVANLEEYKALLKSSDYYESLISKDFKDFLIVVDVDNSVQDEKARKRFVKEIELVMQKYPQFANNQFLGKLYFDYYVNEQIIQDLSKLFLLAIFLISVFLFFIYKNLAIAVSGVFCAVFAALSAVFVIKISSGYITAIDMIAPIVIIAIAISDSVFIFNRWINLNKEDNSEFKDRFRALIKQSYKPCLATSLTSAIGFCSFYFSPIAPLQKFAFAASVSVILSYFIITISNWLFIYFYGQNIATDKINSFSFLRSKTAEIVEFSLQKSKTIYFFLLIIFICFLFAAAKIKTESNFVNVFFKKDSEIYSGIKELDKNLQGSGKLDIIIKTDEQGFFKEVENFNKIRQITNRIEKIANVNVAFSMKNAIKNIHKEISEDGSNFPKNSDQLSQEFLLLEFSRNDKENDILSPYLDFEYQNARIEIITKNLNSAQVEELTKKAITITKQYFSDNISVFMAGSDVYFYKINKYVTQTLIQSIIVTFLAILLIMFLFYGFLASIIAFAISLVPFILTVCAISLSGVAFDFAVIIILATIFAISIDGVIHLIDGYRNIDKNLPAKVRAKINLQELFQALFVNMILFSIIFLIFLISELVLLNKFGFFSFLSILFAFDSTIILGSLILSKLLKSRL